MLGFFTDNNAERTVIAAQANIATAAAAAAGDTVTVSVSFTDTYGNGQLPAVYSVNAVASQPAFVTASAKSATGFTITLTPPTNSVQLSAGTLDVQVVG